MIGTKWALGAAALCLTGAVAAQLPEKSAWSGIYTPEQAVRGREAYAEQCAACHGETLAGIDVAPALVGGGFLNTWSGTSAGDLHERIQQTMPLNAPGSLGGRTVADIEAYILQANGMPPGDLALPPNAAWMRNVKITTQRPE